MTIGLADAIEALRAELVDAEQRARTSSVGLPIESVTVELTLVAGTDAGGKIGFSVPLIGDFGVSAAAKESTSQKVSIVFGAPVGADGSPLRIARDSAVPLD